MCLIAPVPALRGGRPAPAPAAGAARWTTDGSLELCRPRWLNPPGAGAFNPLFLFARLWRVAARLRPPFQVVDAQFGFPDGPAAALLAACLRAPLAVTLRGSEVVHARYRLRGLALRWMFRRAGRVVAVSERLRQFAISLGAPPARVVVIPNGVDSGVFHPRDRAQARRELGIPENVRVFAAAGHLIALKGFDRLIRAFHRLPQASAPAWLCIAGDGRREPQFARSLASLAETLDVQNRIRFCGHLEQDRLAVLMAAADVFCLTSTREGWPNVVHEAMSCGLPVVATDVGAIPQMIPGPDYGLVVPPGDEDALARALEQALARDWDRAAIAARARQRSWSHVASELAAEWRSLAGLPQTRS